MAAGQGPGQVMAGAGAEGRSLCGGWSWGRERTSVGRDRDLECPRETALRLGEHALWDFLRVSETNEVLVVK